MTRRSRKHSKDPSRQETQKYRTAFNVFEKHLNGLASPLIHTVRKAALARFEEIGFPTTHHEEWKYTDITPLINADFKPALSTGTAEVLKTSLKQLPFGDTAWNRLVFVNGLFSAELSSYPSLPKKVRFTNLATSLCDEPERVLRHLTQYARYDQEAFTALSTAFLNDGAYIVIPDGIVLEEPLHLLFVSADLDAEFVSYPRNLILVGNNSQATIVETYVHAASRPYFTNVVAEVVLGENAILEHERIQVEHERAFHMASIHALQGRNSNYVSNSVTFGGALVRNNILPVLDGEGAEATLNGLYIGTGDQLIDNHTTIDHAKPHCTSHELYKGILDGKSRGVFNGKILVRKDAQRTDAKQTNKNLILSEFATVDTKPQLEIFANDVKCTHGATIGQLDEEALFYLRARGISPERARDMLIYAFASEVIEKIRAESLREELQTMLHDRLESVRLPGMKERTHA